MQYVNDRRAARRVAAVIFFTLFVAFIYFHQGGGWNQNTRFNQVRSLVEEGTWWVNNYSAYESRATQIGKTDIRRAPVPDRICADFDLQRLNSWDVSIHEGRIYPNKPPGTTLLAAPAYVLTRRLEQLAGVDPDGWLGLTAGLYLTTVLSVGMLGALCGVLFFLVCRHLFPDLELRHQAGATLAFAFGTIFFPFATMLFDHVAVATACLAGFALVLAAARASTERPWFADTCLVGAGFVLGFAVLLNYGSAPVVLLMALYLLYRVRPRWRIVSFMFGGVAPAIFLAWYHSVAFGGPLRNANTYQLDRFHEGKTYLFSMLGVPNIRALWALLFSDFRGLFVFSPILLLAFYGLWRMLRHRLLRPEATLFLAIFGYFLLLASSFNNWHGGSTFGPRYLIPALPFLALPLAISFARWPRIAAALALFSASINLLGTATAPLIHHSVGHPLIDPVLAGFLGRLPVDPVARGAQGVYELGQYRLFGPESFAARWNSFNVGEVLFPQSRWSLAPLLLVLITGTVLATRRRR